MKKIQAAIEKIREKEKILDQIAVQAEHDLKRILDDTPKFTPSQHQNTRDKISPVFQGIRIQEIRDNIAKNKAEEEGKKINDITLETIIINLDKATIKITSHDMNSKATTEKYEVNVSFTDHSSDLTFFIARKPLDGTHEVVCKNGMYKATFKGSNLIELLKIVKKI